MSIEEAIGLATARLIDSLENHTPFFLRIEGDPRPAIRSFQEHIPLVATRRFRTDGPKDELLWLHDGPGVRAQADYVVAKATLLYQPVRLVCSGPAIDGGHPDLLPTLRLPGKAPQHVGSTQLELVAPHERKTLERRIEGLLEIGDHLEAHALADVLANQHPDYASRYRWLDVLRLLRTGRSSEVLERALSNRSPYDPLGRLQLMLAEASYRQGRMDRFQDLIEAAERGAGPHLAAEARALKALVCHVPLPEQTLDKLPNYLKLSTLALYYREQRAKPTRLLKEEDTPFKPLALSFAENREGEDDVKGHLRIGHFEQAARITARLRGSSSATRLYRDVEPQDRVEVCLQAFIDGDLESATSQLDRLPPRPDGLRSRWDVLHPLLRALLASHQADPTTFMVAIQEARRRSHLDGHRSLVPTLIRAMAKLKPWYQSALAQCLDELQEQQSIRDDLGTFVQTLPAEDWALDAYRLGHVIARGGMGAVYAASHPATGQDVAIKVMRADADRAYAAEFHEEVELCTRLEHPSIVAVLDHGAIPHMLSVQTNGQLHAGDPYLVMELASGGTLEDRMKTLNWAESRRILRHLLDALHYAHGRGLVHRDLKPGNVLFGDDDHPRLTDFGLAVLREGRVAGTPAYMAPEQFQTGPIDHRADLYAIACLAWDMVVGGTPFRGGPMELLRAHETQAVPDFLARFAVPDELHYWLARNLEKRPEHRFQSARVALTALEEMGGVSPLDSVERPTLVSRQPHKTVLDLPASRRDPNVPNWVPSDLPTHIHQVARQPVLRPRIPTHRLFDRGDPPYIGHNRERQALWNAFLGVYDAGTREDIVLHGLPGIGRRRLVRWVRDTARRQGLQVAEHPAEGLAVIEHDEGPSPTGNGPWLVIHMTGRAGPRIRLRPAHVDDLYRQARARLPVSFQTGMLAAHEASGRQAILGTVLAGWNQTMGFQPKPAGLSLAVDTPSPTATGTQGWTQILDAEPTAHVEALSLAALLAPGFSRQTWTNACKAADLPTDDRHCFLDHEPGLRLPVDLRAALRNWLGRRTASAHSLLATIHHTEADGHHRALVHACHSGQPGAAIELAEHVQLRTLDKNQQIVSKEALTVAQNTLDQALEADPETRLWIQIGLQTGHATPTTLRESLKRAEQLDHPLALAACYLAALQSPRWGPKKIPDRTVLAVVHRVPPELAARLRCGIARAWIQRGKVGEAEKLLARTLEQLESEAPKADTTRSLLIGTWVRSLRNHDLARAEALCRDAVRPKTTSHWRCLTALNLSHILMLGGRPDEALDSLDIPEGSQPGTTVIEANRALSHLALGQPEVAAEHADRMLRGRLYFHHIFPWTPIALIWLATHRYCDAGTWADGMKGAGTLTDPLVCSILRNSVSRWSPGPRRQALLARLSEA